MDHGAPGPTIMLSAFAVPALNTGYTYWKKAGERKRSWEWVEHFYAAMKPLSTEAVYVNGLEDEGDERGRSAYGCKYERLTGIKRKYDPNNFFRVNQNIKPAT